MIRKFGPFGVHDSGAHARLELCRNVDDGGAVCMVGLQEQLLTKLKETLCNCFNTCLALPLLMLAG